MKQHPKLKAVDQLMEQSINEGLFPGGELLLAKGEHQLLHKTYGKTSGSDQASALEIDGIYDLASLTKPIATATMVLRLWDQGKLDLYEPIVSFFPRWQGDPKINSMDLLTHRSGLAPWLPLYQSANKSAAWDTLMATGQSIAPQTKVRYSCLNFLILGQLVRLLTGGSLSEVCQNQVFQPMGLDSFSFNPGPQPKIVDSAMCPWRKRRLQGEVHDENAAIFLGEGGNAGLFGAAKDILKFSVMIQNQGLFEQKKILSPEAVVLMVENQNPSDLEPRTAGWDFYDQSAGYWSCGDQLSHGSIGHLGYTGTGVWVDLINEVTYIHLTHRVWFGANAQLSQMKAFRPLLHNRLQLMTL